MPWMSILPREEVIALLSYHSEGGQHLKRVGLTHFSRERRLSFPTGTLWSLCWSCPFLNPRSTRAGPIYADFIEHPRESGSGIHRTSIPPALGTERPGLGPVSSCLESRFIGAAINRRTTNRGRLGRARNGALRVQLRKS